MNRLEKKKNSKLTTKTQNPSKKVRIKHSGKEELEAGPSGESQEKLR